MANYVVGVKEDGNVERVHVSDGMTGKMEGLNAISTSALANPICKARRQCEGSICKHCFACATLQRYTALEKACIRNYEVLNSRLLSMAEAASVRLSTLLARIEAFGDVGSVLQARNYLRIVKANPLSRVGAWTKNPGLWDEAIKAEGKPSNLTMVLSSVYENVEADDYQKYEWVDYVFTVYSPDWLKANDKDNDTFINCGARSCLTCQQCYTKHTDGKVRFIRERRK